MSEQPKPPQFFHQQSPDLHSSVEARDIAAYLRANGDQVGTTPEGVLQANLEFLADKNYVNDGLLTGDRSSIDRQVELKVIKSENVPSSYFAAEQRIAREQGFGHLSITPRVREHMIESLKTDQRDSLKDWAEYLGDNEAGYPDWFRQYVFNGVTKLGNLDRTKNKFQKRSKGTVGKYPELNAEALAYVYDVLANDKPDGGSSGELESVLQGANFGKLYAHASTECMPANVENKKTTEGSWAKYDQILGSHYRFDGEDVVLSGPVKDLTESLKGQGTGWCTAGVSTAALQLSTGDFYVYYSQDTAGKDTVPRVAIRMQDGRVAEVRGIGRAQELEPEMLDVAAEKLTELPGGETYSDRVENSRKLTDIDKRFRDGEELSVDDLRFLYSWVPYSTEGISGRKDPRVEPILRRRSIIDDGKQVFGVDDEDELVSKIFNMNQELELSRINLFPDHSLGQSIAEAMLEFDDHSFLVSGLPKFHNLDENFAKIMLQRGMGEHIVNNTKSFVELSPETIAMVRAQYRDELSAERYEKGGDALMPWDINRVSEGLEGRLPEEILIEMEQAAIRREISDFYNNNDLI